MRLVLGAAALLCAVTCASAETAGMLARRQARHKKYAVDLDRYQKWQRALTDEGRQLIEKEGLKPKMGDYSPKFVGESNNDVLIDLKDVVEVADGGRDGGLRLSVEWKQGVSREEKKRGLQLVSVGEGGPAYRSGLKDFVDRYLIAVTTAEHAYEKVNMKAAMSGMVGHAKDYIILHFSRRK